MAVSNDLCHGYCQERLVLRALARRSIKAYPAQLAGHEIAQLPRLRELVLDCVECPHGESPQPHHLGLCKSCLPEGHKPTSWMWTWTVSHLQLFYMVFRLSQMVFNLRAQQLYHTLLCSAGIGSCGPVKLDEEYITWHC